LLIEYLRRHKDRISFKAFSFAKIALFFLVAAYLLILINNSVWLAKAEVLQQGDLYLSITDQKIGIGEGYSDAGAGSTFETGYTWHAVMRFKYMGYKPEYFMFKSETPYILQAYICQEGSQSNFYNLNTFTGSLEFRKGSDIVGYGWYNQYSYGGEIVYEYFVSSFNESKVNVGDVVTIYMKPTYQIGYCTLYYEPSQNIWGFKQYTRKQPSLTNITHPLDSWDIQFYGKGWNYYNWYEIFGGFGGFDGPYGQSFTTYKVQYSTTREGSYIYQKEGSRYILDVYMDDKMSYNVTTVDGFTEIITGNQANDTLHRQKIIPIWYFTVYDPVMTYFNVTLTSPESYEGFEGFLNKTVTFYFIDSKTQSMIDGVNLTLLGDYSFNGTVDSGFSIEVPNGSIISYNASKEGYIADFNIYGYTPSIKVTEYTWVTIGMIPTNLTVEGGGVPLVFIVKDEDNNPIEDATIVVGPLSAGSSYAGNTNSYGVFVFNVAPNTTYPYTISKEGYISRSGTVSVGTNQSEVAVTLLPEITTATPTPSLTYTPLPQPEGSTLDRGINLLYANAEAIIGLCILATIFGLLKFMRWK
jgi:hypothetical protein